MKLGSEQQRASVRGPGDEACVRAGRHSDASPANMKKEVQFCGGGDGRGRRGSDLMKGMGVLANWTAGLRKAIASR